MTTPTTRPSTLAGSWYPATPAVLDRDLAAYFETPFEGADPPPGPPDLLMVPHAGYAYSGPTAGIGYGLLRGARFDRAVILAPNHRHFLDAIACPDYSALATPLGDQPVDTAAVHRLRDHPAFAGDPAAHDAEHAVEIQVPMLQTVLPEVPIAPLLVPRLAPSLRWEAAKALRDLDGRTLWIVSTDMTHYGADFGFAPFPEDPQQGIRELDEGALAHIMDWDARALLDYGRRTGITMCGLQAMALAMIALGEPAPTLRRLGYARSGDRDGNYDLSVSYATVAGWRDGTNGDETR